MMEITFYFNICIYLDVKSAKLVEKLGALAVAISKKGENAVPRLVRMLDELGHRGREAHGIATTSSVRIAGSIQELEEMDLRSEAAIGHNFSRILPADTPQPIERRGIKLIFEGRFFPPIAENEAEGILKWEHRDVEEVAENILRMDGSYVFALLEGNRLIVGRDPAGLTPLYYGWNNAAYISASERKALWALGIQNARPFPPGNLAIIDEGEIDFKPVKTIFKPAIKLISMDEAAQHLQSLLMESIGERILGVDEIALAFSGGLDSSVIASIAREYNPSIQLLHVGMKGSSETEHAKHVAEFLNLPIHVKTFTEEDVEEVLSDVLWLVEEPNIMKVSVAVPFYWTAEAAREAGINVLLAGQGSDEIFGGYHRYLREYAQSSVKGLEDALYHDVIMSHEVNFERDNKICAFHNVELRLPFVDYDLILFALGLPIDLKIRSQRDRLRKRVLREVAKRIGLPPIVHNMRKRAIQYSTGVAKALRRLAKREGLTLDEFLNQSFLRTLENPRMRDDVFRR